MNYVTLRLSQMTCVFKASTSSSQTSSYCSLNRWFRSKLFGATFLNPLCARVTHANYYLPKKKHFFIPVFIIIVMYVLLPNLIYHSVHCLNSCLKDFANGKKAKYLIINSLQTRHSVGNSFLVFVASIKVRVLNHWLTFFCVPLLLYEIMCVIVQYIYLFFAIDIARTHGTSSRTT